MPETVELEAPQVEQSPSGQPPQQPPVSKAEKLYDNLLKAGFTEKNLGGNKDAFIKNLSNPMAANKFYSRLRDLGFTEKNLGDMVTFRNNFQVPKKAGGAGSPLTSSTSQNGGNSGQNSPTGTNPAFSDWKPSDAAPVRKDAAQWKRQFDENAETQKTLTPQQKIDRDPIKKFTADQLAKGKKEVADYDKLPLSEKIKSVSNSIVSGGGDIAKGAIREASNISQWVFNPDDPKGKEIRQNIASAAKDINNNYIDKGANAISFNISDKDKQLMNEHGVTGAVNGFANFLPAIASSERTGGASFFFNDYEKGYEQIDKLDPKLSEGQKQLYATLRGTASALAMNPAFHSAIAAGGEKVEQAVIDDVSKNAIEELAESGADLTPENVKAVLTKNLSGRALQYAENSLKGAPKSVGTMVGLEGVNIGIEKLINTESGKKIFKQDDIPERLGNAFMNGLGLHLAGALVGATSLLPKGAEQRNDVAESIYHDPSDDNVQNIKDGLAQHLQGHSDEDIAHAHNIIDQFHEVAKDMPKGLKPEQVVPSIEKSLGERQLFERQKKALDDQITSIDEAIKNNEAKAAITPSEIADKEVVSEKLEKEREGLNNELKKTISKQYEAKANPVIEEVPAKTPKADVTGSETTVDQTVDEKSGDNKRVSDADAPQLKELSRNLKEIGNPGIAIEPSYAKEYGTNNPTDEELNNGNKYVVSRDKDGKVNGTLEITYDGDKPTSVKVAVDENSRRQGIATALFKHAEDNGIDLSEVRGKETTEAGQKLYEANKKTKESVSKEIDKKTNELEKADTSDKKLKEQKKDIIDQMQEVHEALNGENGPEAIQRVRDAGYEVNDTGQVTFDVKDDGVFKVHHDGLLDGSAIEQVKKEFPEELNKPQLNDENKDNKNQKPGKPGIGTGQDIELAKENLETAKKAGNKKMQAVFEKEVARLEKEESEFKAKNKPVEAGDQKEVKTPPKEEEKPIEVPKNEEKQGDQSVLQKELDDINKQLTDAANDAKKYIPASTKQKLIDRKAEINKILNPTKVTQGAAFVPIPGIKEFIEHDIKPLIQSIASNTKEAFEKIAKRIRPQIGVSMRDEDTISTNINARNEEAAKIDKLVNGYEKMFDKMKDPERIDFIDRIKRGLKQPTPELQQIADAYKQWDKDLYDAISDIKGNLPFKEDHFRVLWKKIPGAEEKTRNWFGRAKRPLEGSKGFLKKATLVDMSEGIAKGGEPVSTNPMTMFKLAHADATRFITAHRMFDALKEDGVIKFVKTGKEAPENYTRINDKIANVYFPVKEGMVKAGEFYIESNVGRLVNNLLSEDKIRYTAVGKGILALKNAYTAIELSLSPFHATVMSLEAVSSDVGKGIRKTMGGDVKGGIADILKAPFAPKTTFSLGRNYIKLSSQKDFENSDFGKSFLEKNPLAKQYLHDFFMGGGLTHQDNVYKLQAYQGLRDQLAKDNFIGAGLRALPALNEMLMSPLFDTYIPALKVGMFMKEYPLTLVENALRLESGKVTREALARKTSDFIDDRLGEMNFDNLYWDRTFKTATQLFFRSVTWKLGNARALGGAIPEQGMEFYNAYKEGRHPILQPKIAWLFGLAATHAAISTLVQYGFTGTTPQNFKDLMWPRLSNDDNKDRAVIPDYTRDITSIAYQGLSKYVQSSMAGDNAKILDVWNNSDFQKYEIYNPNDPIFTKSEDALKYMLPQPIGFSQVGKDISKGTPIAKSTARFIGLSPAPKYITNTPIENKIFDLYNVQEGIKTKHEKDKADLKDKIRDLYKAGKVSDADKLVDQGIDSGDLSVKEIKYLLSSGKEGKTPAVYLFNGLKDDNDKVWLYNQMTESEKEEYDPKGTIGVLAEKRANAEKSKKQKPYSSFK